ncbi:MAG: patatin-like phospholipase family protein [Elusimicrobia bacterium]|nr:patatin-like phospholipase family protein [Elusimicrobiota bacterium]
MKLLLLPLFLLLAAPARAQVGDDEILREALWTRAATARPPARPAVGLALSGGGARGFAHTGVLEALGYAGFPVDYVAGTSMGALIGAIYSSGQPIEELWTFGRDAARLKVGKDFTGIKMLPLLIADKLITPKYITRFIESRMGGLTFEKLKKPFACTAMDIRTGEKVVFTEGPLDIAVRASVNLPGVFAPVQYRHRYLVDGGVVDNVPVDAARDLGADWVLASVMENSINKNPESVLTTLLQVIDIRGSLLAKESEKASNFVMRAQVGDMSVADFDRCTEAGEAGLASASAEMDAARENFLIYAAPRLVEKL